MPRLALATAIAHVARDDDLGPLLDACGRQGIDVVARAWDDASVGWSSYDAVLLRSTWDYCERLGEFLHWCGRVDACTRLLNPLPVVAWNTDKRYLDDLAERGVPVVPTRFVDATHEPLGALHEIMAMHPEAAEFVVKPTIGAGARGAQRFTRAQEFAASNHLAHLLETGHGAMLQPYQASVDRAGETALMFFDGVYSHAIRKGPQLARDPDSAGPAPDRDPVRAQAADADEQALAQQVLATAGECLGRTTPLLYARVDLIRGADGAPRLLELELTEPSLFFAHAPGSEDRFAAALARLLLAPDGRARP